MQIVIIFVALFATTFVVLVEGHGFQYVRPTGGGGQYYPPARPRYFRDCNPSVPLNRPGQHQGWSSLMDDSPSYPPPSLPATSGPPALYACDSTYGKNCNNDHNKDQNRPPPRGESRSNPDVDTNPTLAPPPESFSPIQYYEKEVDLLKPSHDAAEAFKNRPSTTATTPIPSTTSITTTTDKPTKQDSHNNPPSPGYPAEEDNNPTIEEMKDGRGPLTEDDPNYFPRFQEEEQAERPDHSNKPHPKTEGYEQRSDITPTYPTSEGDSSVQKGESPSSFDKDPSPTDSSPLNSHTQYANGDGWSSPTNDYDTKFANEVLEGHNFYRAQHRVSPLALDEELSKLAQALASSFASGAPFIHSQDSVLGDYGESIAVHGGGGDIMGSEAVTSWYKEHVNYDFSEPKLTPSNSDFTAIVWSRSRQLGVGKAKTGDGRTFVVCTYFPPGNDPSKLKENVFSPIVNRARHY